MPCASMRAVTSADVPAGNSTVISTLPRLGKGTSCAIAGAAVASSTAPAINLSRIIQDLGDGDPAPLASGDDAGEQHGQRGRGALAVHLRLSLSAHRGGKLLELLDDRVVGPARHGVRAFTAALEKSQALLQVV